MAALLTYGAVNTFSTFSPQTLSNGAYTASQAASNPLCFAVEYALANIPAVTGLSSTLLAPLTKQLNSAAASMNCASIGSVNTGPLGVCSGMSWYGGPSAAVAPGAIQDS